MFHKASEGHIYHNLEQVTLSKCEPSILVTDAQSMWICTATFLDGIQVGSPSPFRMAFKIEELSPTVNRFIIEDLLELTIRLTFAGGAAISMLETSITRHRMKCRVIVTIPNSDILMKSLFIYCG